MYCFVSYFHREFFLSDSKTFRIIPSPKSPNRYSRYGNSTFYETPQTSKIRQETRYNFVFYFHRQFFLSDSKTFRIIPSPKSPNRYSRYGNSTFYETPQTSKIRQETRYNFVLYFHTEFFLINSKTFRIIPSPRSPNRYSRLR